MKTTRGAILVLLTCLFVGQLQEYLPILTYADEFITVVSLFYIVSHQHLLKESQNRYLGTILSLIILITVYGLLCNFGYGRRTEIIPILNDIGNCFKVFITYVGCTLLFQNTSDSQAQNMLQGCYRVLKIIVPIMAIFGILNLIGDFGMRIPDNRFGIPVYAFIYSGGGSYSSMFYMIVTIILAWIGINNVLYKRPSFFLILTLFTWALGLRSRAFLFILLLVILYYWIVIKNKNVKINLTTVFLGLGLFVLVCSDQAEHYMGNENMPRYILAYYGIQTLQKYFPFGAGFGTYGTDVAAKFYSPLYYDYGFDNLWALNPEDYSLAHDNYWPAIFGQFGFIGTILFALLIFYLFKDIMQRSKGNKFIFIIGIFTCFSQFVASLATSTFFSPVIVYLMYFVPLVLRLNYQTSIEYE